MIAIKCYHNDFRREICWCLQIGSDHDSAMSANGLPILCRGNPEVSFYGTFLIRNAFKLTSPVPLMASSYAANAHWESYKDRRWPIDFSRRPSELPNRISYIASTASSAKKHHLVISRALSRAWKSKRTVNVKSKDCVNVYGL